MSWTVNARTLDEVERILREGQTARLSELQYQGRPGSHSSTSSWPASSGGRHPPGFCGPTPTAGTIRRRRSAAAPRLADVGVDVLEAPLRPNQISGYQALKRQGALPILMDEGVVSPVELEEFIRLKMLDGVAMKPSRCGGLMSNKRQIEIIEQEGLMWLGSGLTDPDISLAAALWPLRGLRTAEARRPERPAVPDRRRPENASADRQRYRPRSRRPGLGIEVDEQKIARLMDANH